VGIPLPLLFRGRLSSPGLYPEVGYPLPGYILRWVIPTLVPQGVVIPTLVPQGVGYSLPGLYPEVGFILFRGYIPDGETSSLCPIIPLQKAVLHKGTVMHIREPQD